MKSAGQGQASPSLKIGLVFDDSLDRPDGVQQYVVSLGKWLASQGHSVHYLVGQTSRQDLPNLHSLSRNLQVRFNGNRLSIPVATNGTAIRKLLQQEQFDVLHVMMPYSPLMAQRVIMQAPAKTVIFGTFHILPFSRIVRWSTKVLGWWLRPSLRRIDEIVAVSSTAGTFAEAAFTIPVSAVMPNMVETSLYAAAQPELVRHNQARLPTILYLGRLVPRKGCATLLLAVAHLKQRYSEPFRVLICGKGPLLDELKALANRLDIDDNVIFTGFVSEITKPNYLAAADVAVFPSSGGESFGIVLIEAMAAGLSGSGPVVLAANNPGYATVMEPRPEALFEPQDSQALADLLQHYLTDAGQRQAAIDWQNEYVQQFDTGVVGAKLVVAYTRQLQKKAAA